MLISVDFWKSMHGFAMDSRTRDILSVFNFPGKEGITVIVKNVNVEIERNSAFLGTRSPKKCYSVL